MFSHCSRTFKLHYLTKTLFNRSSFSKDILFPINTVFNLHEDFPTGLMPNSPKRPNCVQFTSVPVLRKKIARPYLKVIAHADVEHVEASGHRSFLHKSDTNTRYGKIKQMIFVPYTLKEC